MAIPEGAIYSEDGLKIIGVRNRKDRKGNVLPESEWMYKRPVWVKTLEQLMDGTQTAALKEASAEGRKTAHEAKIDAFLRAVERGVQQTPAAKAARLSPDTIAARKRQDPVFAERVKDAERVWLESVRSVVFDEIIINKNAELGLRVLSKLDPAFADKKDVTTTNITRLELPDGDRVAGVLTLIERLKDRKELAVGKVIDIESSEE